MKGYFTLIINYSQIMEVCLFH